MPSIKRCPIHLVLTGSVLILWAAWTTLLSPRLHYSAAPPAMGDIVLFNALYVAAGVVYLIAVLAQRTGPSGRSKLAWIILIGVVLRLMMFASAPILQNDFNRYLWDGAVTASGLNPYVHAPAEARESGPATPDRLRTLATEGRQTLPNVNHPWLKTIYPPVAQGVFALAYVIEPWSETAWRGVLLAFDAATLALLIALLGRLGRPVEWVMIYWWCPVAVFETFNGLHMDALAGPFVAGAVLLAVRGRAAGGVGAMGMLGLAVGVKLWPIVLAPPLLRWEGTGRGARIFGAILLAMMTALVLGAMASGGVGRESGTLAYAESWYNNSALYLLQLMIWRPALALLNLGEPAAHSAARVCIALAMAGWVAWLTWRPVADAADLCRRCALIAAAVFLLAPAQFPWYFLWPLPLLTLAPLAPILLYAVLIPLYYLEYDYPALAWLEHVPIWIMIALDYRYAISKRLFDQHPRSQPAQENGSPRPPR